MVSASASPQYGLAIGGCGGRRQPRYVPLAARGGRAALVLACALAASLAHGQAVGQWKEWVVEGVAVLMPGTPERRDRFDQVSKCEIHHVTLAAGELEIVALERLTDVAKGRTVDQLLDLGRDTVAASVRGKVVSEKKIKLQEKIDGREVRIALPDRRKTLLVRTYWVNGRAYFLLALGPPAFVNGKEASKFMDSLRLAAE